MPPAPRIEPPLVLASSSPRRRELLARAGVPFEVHPPRVAEIERPGEAPADLAERLAREKAAWVAERVGAPPPRLVLGADTIVVIEGRVLGKPATPEHALSLLRQLTGRTHRVMTGIAVVESASGATRTRVVTSRVTLHPLDDHALRAYLARGESMDKAGAYAAQGAGRELIERIEGSESNVIGLPVEETLALLRAAGLVWERAA